MNAHKVWTLGGRIRRLGALLLLALLAAVTSANAVAEGLRFSLVRTAQSESGDFLLRRGGWQHQPQTQHIAILIEHRGTRLLFGTGLGRQIDEQLDAELPWRTKRYGEVQPVRDQLERDGLAIDRIVLGCVRWEHASGLVDFPGVPVLASPDSLDYLQTATPPAVLRSQFRRRASSAIRSTGSPCSSIHGLISGTRRAWTCSATDSWCWYRWPDTARLACT